MTRADREAKKRELRKAIARITRDGFGRFVRIERLKACSEGDDCELEEARDWQSKYRQTDAALETIEEFIASTDPDMVQAGREIFLDFRRDMRGDAGEVERREQVSDRLRSREEASLLRQDYEAEVAGKPIAAFVDTREVDAVDLTGLEPIDAKRLALRLAEWNPNAKKVYKWRGPAGGKQKRYLNPSVSVIDLNDPIVREIGLDDDIWPVVREKHIPVHYEANYVSRNAQRAQERREEKKREAAAVKPEPVLEQQDGKAAKRLSSEELARQARVAKQAQSEQNGLGMTAEYSLGGGKQGGIF